MEPSLKLYQYIIDSAVEHAKTSVHEAWVKERGWPDLPENKAINDLLAGLSDSEKDVFVSMLQSERESGIHDLLVELNERMLLNGLRIVEGGV